jgi:hypothetical protein
MDNSKNIDEVLDYYRMIKTEYKKIRKTVRKHKVKNYFKNHFLLTLRILSIFYIIGYGINYYIVHIKVDSHVIIHDNKETVYIQDSSKTHAKFLEDLAYLESRGSYDPQPRNPNYYGKYQIGRQALMDIGLNIATEDFVSTPEIQEFAITLLLKKNKKYLQAYIGKFEGKMIAGIYITQSGLLAGAQLGGAGSVMNFLDSGGTNDFKDGNGTPISKYIRKFSGYKLNL